MFYQQIIDPYFGIIIGVIIQKMLSISTFGAISERSIDRYILYVYKYSEDISPLYMNITLLYLITTLM